MPKHRSPVSATCAALLLAASGFAQSPSVSPIPIPITPALRRITPAELKGDLSFLASDALAGRFTPSPGLEVAAEFIASKFRAFGLEPGGDQDYFQTAHMIDRQLPSIEGTLKLRSAKGDLVLTAGQVQVSRSDQAVSLRDTPALVFGQADPAVLQKIDVHGKAVVGAAPDYAKLPRDQARAAYRQMRAFSRAVEGAGASLELLIAPNDDRAAPAARLLSVEDAAKHRTPIVMVFASDPSVKRWFETASASGPSENSVSVNIPAAADTDVTVKNVIGILRGSDPKLKNTCVLLTAHYDHIGTVETARGMASPGKGPSNDRIYNGANDDGSGTVSVIETARALSSLKPHPKRSIVFITFFGEERGELGSQFYTEHPVFPLARTVADINLEQVGRTDSTNGPQVNTASLTGYDYSDVTKYVEQAGRLTGIKVYRDPEASDPYFTQSDNSPLAEAGIPAHSLTVAFDYPDYHGLGDEWQKIDYENMARVDRMVALATLDIAQSVKPPAWNAQNAKTEKFREAQQRDAGH